MKYLEKNKGITLIALIVTIIVLLILAGVTISQITGNESAMDKAKEAKEKNEQGAELDAIKMAVVNSVASDLTGLVNAENLKEGLNGIVEDEGRLKINQDNAPWIVTGKTGMKYKIKQNGEVISVEPVVSVEFVSTTDEIAVSKSKKLSIIARGASGNTTEANKVTFTSSNTSIATVEDDGTIKIVNDDSKIGQTVEISVIADGINGANTCTITIVELIQPKIGDFVDYRAGEWTKDDLKKLGVTFKKESGNETNTIDSNGDLYAGSEKVYAEFKFSGFGLGDSKDANRDIYGTALDVNKDGGWRILSLNEDGTINEIIHAGTSEGFTIPRTNGAHYKSQYIFRGEIHPNGTSAWTYSDIKVRDWSMYATGTFGVSARITTYEEQFNRTGSNKNTNDIIRNVGNRYWLDAQNENWIRLVYGGQIGDFIQYGETYGIRPVVKLQSGVSGTYTGEETTHTTKDTAWTLTK